VAQVSSRHLIGLALGEWECEIGLDRGKLDRLRYQPGDLFLTRKNVEEWVRWKTSGEILLVDISDAVFDEVAHEIHRASVPCLEAVGHLDDPRARGLLHAIEAERKGGFAAGRLFLESLSRALASLLLTSCGGVGQARRYRGGLTPRRLNRVVEYIEANLARDLSLLELAQVTSLSAAHFAQMFRVSMGVPPHRYLLKRRVEQAKQMLAQSNERVLDIALKTGFRSQQHFARVFRSICRMTPSEFRGR